MGLILGPAHPTQAALVDNGKGPQLLVGLDDDKQDNVAIQAGAGANQSLNRWFNRVCQSDGSVAVFRGRLATGG